MNKTKTKIGILALCAVALSYMAISPIIASIGGDFPDVSESMVQMVLTLPSFMFIICSPLSGIAMEFMNKKTIALGALMGYLVGGLFPFFFYSNIWCLLIGSGIIGLGTGFLMPLINGLIVQYFEKDERAQLMGLNATFTALGALLFIFAGGQLAAFGWRYTYLVFVAVVIIIGIVVACLPKGEPQHTAGKEKKKGAFEMNPYIFGLFVIGFIYFLIQNSFNTNSSMYVAKVLGGGAAVASMITMVNTLGGIIGGTIFARISKALKYQIETFTLAIVGVGFLIAYFIPNIIALIIGSILIGFGFAMFNAAGTLLLSWNTSAETNAFTVSVYLALINFGASISPIAVNSCAGLFGGSVGVKYLFSGIVILVIMVYSAILNLKKRNS